jgi:hypothetical protein
MAFWYPHLCAAIINLRSNKVEKSPAKNVLETEKSAGTTRTGIGKIVLLIVCGKCGIEPQCIV